MQHLKALIPLVTKLFAGLLTGVLVGLMLGLALSATSCTRSSKTTTTITKAEANKNDSRFLIVGGRRLSPNEDVRRSTVGLYDLDSGTLCTGTIIGDKQILTAAHCVEDLFSLIVFFGDSIDEMGLTSVVSQIALTGTYVKNQNNRADIGDVAVVQIEDSIPPTHKISPLLSLEDSINEGDDVVIVGYGATSGIREGTSGDLRMAHVQLVQKHWGHTEFITDQSNGAGACFGDSGGPAYVLRDGTYQLLGIASRVGNAPNQDPCQGIAFYSHSRFYQPFIEQALLDLGDTVESR